MNDRDPDAQDRMPLKERCRRLGIKLWREGTTFQRAHYRRLKHDDLDLGLVSVAQAWAYVLETEGRSASEDHAIALELIRRAQLPPPKRKTAKRLKGKRYPTTS